MATKLVHETMCSTTVCDKCPCGWLRKKFLGLCLGVWLILFAILPHSARGVAWTVNAVSGLWDRGEAVINVEDRPRRRDRGQGSPPDFGPRNF